MTDGKLCLLFQLGLTLRRTREKNKTQWKQLRDRILNNYDVEGLHIAQFVQNGLFNRYFAIIVERGLTDKQISEEINNFFDNIETSISYIQENIRSTTNEIKEAKKIISNIQEYHPHVYIICGSNNAAGKCKRIKDNVMKNIPNYTEELYRTNKTDIYFLKKQPKHSYKNKS